MKEKWIRAYVRGNIFMKDAVRKVLVDRKGASTVEYVAVLAGAAALGGVILTTVKGGVGKSLTDKIKNIVSGIGK
ncbi:hypothetical protein ACFQ40_07460 [Kroppenstedtia eburnea]|uniref:hypothetical protein n=1 Tax=Kroppenstedtia eburnea TaxID=714067 RepID=UPI00362A2B0B